MNIRHHIVATAGHVDHGKSALVKALTGTDPDRWAEEKARGITIDLGFAQLKLTDPSVAEGELYTGIVDVPGHEDFVKNMAVGVSSADAVLLVVAADDGWMPQTAEHVEILTYLGITRAVVALTKIDLVEQEAEITSHVREHLTDTPFAEAPIVPTSVTTGRGLTELKSTLFKCLCHAPTAKDFGKPRLFVDRVFVLKGVGTVVTGTLTGGSLDLGDQVVIQPYGQVTRIRRIETHNHDVQSSGPGHRTALCLSHVSPRSPKQCSGIRRGDVVTTRSDGEASRTINVVVSRITVEHEEKVPPLKSGTRVRIHHGSANCPGRICFLESRELLPGEKQLAQLRLESPLYAFEGDRFVVRDWAQRATIGGGIMLEVNARRGDFRSELQRTFLSERARAADCSKSWLIALIDRDKVIARDIALHMTRFNGQEIQRALDAAVAENKALDFETLIVESMWWHKLLKSAKRMVDERHQDNPEEMGLKLTELKDAIPVNHYSDQLFAELVSCLCANEFTKQDAMIRRTSHVPQLPRQLQRASKALLSNLEMRPLDPPPRRELVQSEGTRQALHFLLKTGQVVEISDKMLMSESAFVTLTKSVTAFLRWHGSATVSEIRQELGTSRRIAIPLLEKLDREGVTLRDGPKRVLRKSLGP